MSENIKQYGWFAFQYDTAGELLSISNYLTQQTLTVTNRENIDDPGDRIKYTASYRDEDFSQSVTFSICRKEPFQNKPSEYFDIHLNYADSYDTAPPYAHWRRLDVFLYDALLCWRPQRISHVYLTSGWFSGQWCQQTRRCYGVINGLSWADETRPIAPYLPPLDNSLSQTWQLFDLDDDNKNNTKPEYQLNYRCIGNTIPYLPLDEKPQGLKGKVPYLQRTDKNAYFIFSHAEFTSHRDDPIVNTYYTYLDEEVFFTFRSYGSLYCELGEAISRYGFRKYPPKPELWGNQLGKKIDPSYTKSRWQDYATAYFEPSYPVWLQSVYAFFDAWPAWKNCQYQLQKKRNSYLDWNARYGGESNIRDGFVAGMPACLYIDIEYA